MALWFMPMEAEVTMADEDKFWLVFWGFVGVVIIVVAMILTYGSLATTRMFVDGGYCYETLVGAELPYWTKCDGTVSK